MNCEKLRNDILLAESGELSLREQRRVESHVAACAACRAYREDLRNLVHAARTGAAQADPDHPADGAMARIRERAAEAPPLRMIVFRRPAFRVAAAAALLLVALGGWHLLPSTLSDRDKHIRQIAAVMTMMAGEDDESAGGRVGEDTDSLRELARQLLILEGLGEEQWNDAQFWEPDPTDLQSRSISATRGIRRV